MNKIIKIEEGVFKHKQSEYEGYVITTEKSVYNLGIDSDGQCCESWGYLSSNDNLEEFIGAEILSVKLTDNELFTVDALPKIYEGDMTFFTVDTDQGSFQIVAYNEHNGYYSHDVLIVVDGELIEHERV